MIAAISDHGGLGVDLLSLEKILNDSELSGLDEWLGGLSAHQLAVVASFLPPPLPLRPPEYS